MDLNLLPRFTTYDFLKKIDNLSNISTFDHEYKDVIPILSLPIELQEMIFMNLSIKALVNLLLTGSRFQNSLIIHCIRKYKADLIDRFVDKYNAYAESKRTGDFDDPSPVIDVHSRVLIGSARYGFLEIVDYIIQGGYHIFDEDIDTAKMAADIGGHKDIIDYFEKFVKYRIHYATIHGIHYFQIF